MSEFQKSILSISTEKVFADLKSMIENENNIFLFGAGNSGMTAIQWLEADKNTRKVSIKGIFDNNNSKQGKTINGHLILNPQLFFSDNKYNGEMILITSEAIDAIKKQLNEYGVPNSRIRIFTLSSYLLIGFKGYLETHIREFDKVYEMLEDQKSKDVFLNVINFKLSRKFELIEHVADDIDEIYFDKSIVKFNKSDVYVDCGAFIGDTVSSYVKHNKGNYKEIISVEASPNTYKELVENTKVYHNVKCLNMGVWNKHGVIKFTNEMHEANRISDDGEIEVKTDTLDSIVGDRHVTHIKMDIEGAEIPALLGAYDTIQRCKPTLAICAYHKIDDFIKIPMIIKAFCPDYRIYFRHYSKISNLETVCYAVFNEKS